MAHKQNNNKIKELNMPNEIFISILCIFSLTTNLALKNCEKKDSEKCFYSYFYAKNYNGSETEVFLEDEKILLSHAAEVRRTIPCESNVRYGSRERQTLDIYGGDLLPPDATIFVSIFGGAWMKNNNSYAAGIAKPLLEAGIRTITPNYDLIPQVNMDTQREDIREMANFVLALAEKNNSRGVWFEGHSAAGQTTSELIFDDYLMTVDESRRKLIKGFFILSGYNNLTAVRQSELNNIIHLTREDVDRHSPLLKINQLSIARSSKYIVFLSMVEFDTPVVNESMMKLLQLFMDNGIHVRFMYIPDEDHFTENNKLYYSDFELTRAIISLIKS